MNIKTIDTDTLDKTKKCQPCWYIILSTMYESATVNTILISLQIQLHKLYKG
jgi:hypothetical protein